MCCRNLCVQKHPSLNFLHCGVSVLGCPAHWCPAQLFYRQQTNSDVSPLVLFLLPSAPYQPFLWLMCFTLIDLLLKWLRNFWAVTKDCQAILHNQYEKILCKNVIVKSDPSRLHQITFRLQSIKHRSESVSILIIFFPSFLCFSLGFF